MEDPKENKLKEFWLMIWLPAWGFLTRPFLTCDVNSCYGFIEPEEVAQLDPIPKHEKNLYMVAHDNYENDTFLYIYYCPYCGRRARPGE